MEQPEAAMIAQAAVLNAILTELEKRGDKSLVLAIAATAQSRGGAAGVRAGDANSVVREIKALFNGTQTGAGMSAPPR